MSSPTAADSSNGVVVRAYEKPISPRKVLRQMLRSAMYAALARWAFGAVKSVLKGGISKKTLEVLSREIFSMNPIKWAAVIGALSSYRGLQQMMFQLIPLLGAKGSCLLAGAMTSLGFMAMNVETRTEIALYTSVRAAHGILLGNVFPKLPEPMQDFKHWDVVTMSVSAMSILYTLFFEPRCHTKSYLSFLQNCTMQDPRSFAATAAMHRRQIVPEMIDFCRSHNLPPPTSTDVPLTDLCTYFHNGNSCVWCTINFIRRHVFGFSLRLYLPLKIITTLVFGRTKALKDPLGTLQKIATQSFSSSMFLTLYCALPWGLLCSVSNLGIRNPALLGMTGGLLAGLPTLLEPKSRRMDLGLYCSMHAFRSTYLLLVYRGYLKRPTRYHIMALSAAATAGIFYQFDHQRDSLHRNVSGTVGWLLGEKSTVASPQDGEQGGKRVRFEDSEGEPSSPTEDAI